MVKMAIMAVMEWYNMATNMAVIGVYIYISAQNIRLRISNGEGTIIKGV